MQDNSRVRMRRMLLFQERAKAGPIKAPVVGGATSKGYKNKDMGKVKCFACNKTGHYASQCPNKNKGKSQVAASAEVEFSARFYKEFSLVACLSSSSVSTSVWYIDSGSSSHMDGSTRVLHRYIRELFRS